MTSTPPTPPPSRAARRRETRAALVDAAREVFARDGYHAASLEEIAHQAGFSKGAVYSNFASKADLFLAVMDANLAYVRGPEWQLSSVLDPDGGASAGLPRDPDPAHADLVRGVALATLEFIAAAMRDPVLGPGVTARARELVDAYRELLDDVPADDEFDHDELALLLAGLDQGLALLVVAGAAPADGDELRRGLRRLLGAGAPPVTRPPDARG